MPVNLPKNKTTLRNKQILLISVCFLVVIWIAFTGRIILGIDVFANEKDLIKEKNERLLTVVNKQSPLPAKWKFEPVLLGNGLYVDSAAYSSLQSMMNDARAAGLSPKICSAYRSYEKQASLYQKKVETYLLDGYEQDIAEYLAGFWVAPPGESEHQLGLALDIVSEFNQIMESFQDQTKEQQWLIKNCYKYGFILRYPKDKQQITGKYYEPWHYRYVGKKAALEITQKKLCLEEYAEQLKS